jgi:5-hydroxyisourate hydrolase-like protein (transthyretin family)
MSFHAHDVVINSSSGRPMAGVSVLVLKTSDGLAANLYSDTGGTTLANPAITDKDGNYDFYVANGNYTLEFRIGDDVFKRIPNLEMASVYDLIDEIEGGTGPVPAGAIGAAQITNNATEQKAIVTKLGLNNRRRVYNLDEYGGIGNSNGIGVSGTDDSAALNSALAAMKAAGGGHLVIPKGKTFRIAQSQTLIDFDRCEIVLDGDLYFSNTSLGFWGRLFVDGTVAPGGRITGFHLEGLGKMLGVPGLHTAGQFINGVYTNAYAPGGGPGYGGEDCILTMRSVSGFQVIGAEFGHSPNYVISGLDIEEGAFEECRVHHGTAAIQVQDGSRSVTMERCHGYDTSDDVFAFGYWGARNKDAAILDCRAERSGARGLVAFAQDNVRIQRNDVRDTFLAGLLVECSNFAGDRVMESVFLTDNRLKNAGMYDGATYARGVDVAAPIRIATSGGTIKKAIVTGNQSENGANSHFTCDGVGLVEHLELAGNLFDGIGRIIKAGAPIPAPAGGGSSIAPPDNYFPGVKINNARYVKVHDNTVVRAHEDGVYISPIARVAHVHDNHVSRINDQIDGGSAFPSATGYKSDAKQTFRGRNGLDDSPATSVLYAIANVAADAGALIPRQTILASDNFNRADGALGTTPVGSKTWVGAGTIESNKARFALANEAAVFNAGQADVEVTVTINPTTAGQRIIVRADGTSPSTGAAIIADLSGNLFHYNGATIVATAPFPAVPVGTAVVIVLEVKGNIAVLYINGGVAAILRGTFPTTNFVGFQDNSAGLGRFDDFTVRTPL